MYFTFPNNVQIVKGAKRSIILDLQKNEIHFLKQEWSNILVNSKCYTKSDFKINFGEEIYQFLFDNDLIIVLPDISTCNLFLSDDFSWDYPSIISNSIIEIIDFNHYFNIEDQLIELMELYNCKHFEIRILHIIPFSEFNRLIRYLNKFTNCSFYIIVSNGIENQNKVELLECIKQSGNVKICNFYNSEKNEEVMLESSIIRFLKYRNNKLCCGSVGYFNFRISYPLFTESQHHNTCLNRKIAIDAAGNIKNCPSMKESFGNIKDTSLAVAINKPGFKKYWNIKKEEITKCKDCEFRHICTDCRAYLENPEDSFSAPLKCGYDPYTSEWEEWSNNALKQKAIDYYKMREIL